MKRLHLKRQFGIAGVTVALCVLSVSPLLGDQGTDAAVARLRPGTAAPAPPPVLPATLSRTAEGGVTVRAVRLSDALKFDGRLDESVYSTVSPIDGFIQQEPREGEPATEKTEVWVFFDDKNIYVSARCWDSQPERAIANEMRRDSQNILQNEAFSIFFDTFHDRRSGFNFSVAILGGLFDTLVAAEGNSNRDWNGVWDARVARFDSGWTTEVAFPFKSLRYGAEREQVWGVQFRRIVRWKSEVSHLTAVPAFLTMAGHLAASLDATMVGLEVPPPGLNLDLKPYAISGLRTDLTSRPQVRDEKDGRVGFDAKWGITKGLTADFTYKTDFAQVEDDLQQVNLTRFNLFFPEKREFFLEGSGLFAFGGVSTQAPAAGSPASNTPVLFFSRRIGLNNGQPAPIVAGGRLTGRAGRYSIGVLDIQSGDDPQVDARATNFATLRIRRDLFSRSSIGALYTRREETGGAAGTDETLGIDALYSASRSLNIHAFLAKTRTPGLQRDDTSHLARFDYNTDRYGLQLEQLSVGKNFNPAVGFLRRTDFHRGYALARFSPRPARTHMRAVRRFVYQGSVEYFENGAGRVDMRETGGSFELELLNGDSLTVGHVRDYEFIPRPFAISSSVSVPVGGYDYQSSRVSYFFGTQRRLAGTLSYQEGSLYEGTKRTLGFATGRLEVSPQLAIEPIISANWVKLPWGDFMTTVVSGRVTYTLTPRMFVSTLIQDNSSAKTLTTNARFRWEYLPGSELFVVYSDGRDTLPRGFPALTNRAFVVKVNRLFRF
ncbi:MAG: carbohydrate binding family 9 domain-containing protein [Acidobacteria bacterium]|nr:carbohydrate binding family 9 domain-containing protein [Acidobacteriota bacterium]